MARGQNFFYQDPTADIAGNLAKAIFGDPAAAAQQRQQQAEIHERQSRAGLLQAQANGQIGQNEAAAGLPALLREFAAANAPRPPGPGIDSPEFADFGTPMPAPAPRPDPTVALANLIAGMGVMNGDKIDPTKIMGAYGAFGGDDEMARRSLVAQGSTPGKDFAITPERADAIALANAMQDQKQAFGVAEINNRDNIPVANIRRASAFDVATVNNRDNVPVANIRANASRDVAGIKVGGSAPGFDAITRAIPGATMNSGLRSPERNAAVGGVSNSTHLGQTPGVQGYDIPPQRGTTIEQARAAIEAANPGVRVIEALNEGDHWHFALQNIGGSGKGGKGGKAAADKPPKPLKPAELKMLDAELDNYYTARGLTIAGDARGVLRSEAIRRFQQTGDPVSAVVDTVNARAASHRAKQAKPPAKPSQAAGAPVPGARKAQDGKWYVQTGTKPDGSPSYSRVD